MASKQCQMSAENIDSPPMQSEIYATQMYPMQLEIHPMSSWIITENGESGGKVCQ